MNIKLILIKYPIALTILLLMRTSVIAQDMTGGFTTASQHIYQINKDETENSDAAIRLQCNTSGNYQDWIIWNREGTLNFGFWSASSYGTTSENEIDNTYLSISPTGTVAIPNSLRLGTGTTSSDNSAVLNVFGKMHISPEGTLPTSFSDEYDSDFLLWVEKGIVSNDFLIADAEDWPDYVFEKNYELTTLEELEKFINTKGHLPGIPSEDEIIANGYTIHDMNVRFLEKIEELTLYSIDQNKRILELSEKLGIDLD